ncbi:MAG: thioredoxin domain-containing protein [Acidobacteriaceae bacterium]
MTPPNKLRAASSSYLRSAMHQPVDWHEWGVTAFARATEEDKPILLDIGAVWCHWCHVMDRESYEDPKLAEVINHNYIAVKVDRDERPDVDTRYQAAVGAMSEQGGWPLTVVLTPDGKPFFGGTYFPKDDRYGRPGFEHVLRTLADAWKSRRDEVLESAGSVLAAIEQLENFAGQTGNLRLGIVDQMVASTMDKFDRHHGGFGLQPKFAHPSSVDLLLDVAGRTGDQAVREAATLTLEKMAHGGVYDHLGGGFHRYSVDEAWVVPHFEKMLYDNAQLLTNYVHAFQGYADQESARIAREVVGWLDHWMTDRDRGGFYASQDADINLDDDGDYFTWTRAEAGAVLTTEEMEIAGLFYDIGDLGDMHHNPAKNVLHVKQKLDTVAGRVGKSPAEAAKLLTSARDRLLAARERRPAPFIDTTVYTNWNALAVSAYFRAAQVLRQPEVREFAVLTLDRLLRDGLHTERGLAHVISYDRGGETKWVAGMLDDYALLIHACLDGWGATGSAKYYEAALDLAERMIAEFHDSEGGGFFDARPRGDELLGALTARRKPLQDSPTPAGNPAAAAALLRLEALNGRADLRQKAVGTLEAFAGVAPQFGLYAGTYGLALESLLLTSVQVVIVGEDVAADELEAAALVGYAVNKTVIRLTRFQAAGRLPPLLAEMLPPLLDLHALQSFAVVCKENSCLPPASDAKELRRLLQT